MAPEEGRFSAKDNAGQVVAVISSAERIVVRTLFSASESVSLYFFHERFKLSAGQLFSICDSYSRKGFLIVHGTSAKLTEAGRLYVWQNRGRLFRDKGHPHWQAAPRRVDWKDVQPFDLAPPHYNWLDPRFLIKDPTKFRISQKNRG